VERPEKPSRLGNWSYEVADCKLARETKAETILQLCLYSELVAELQGIEPEFFHVVRPNVGLQLESYRLSAFAAYYRIMKVNLLGVVEAGSADTYPDPVSHCDICRWWRECDGQRRRDDHLSFVAGASKLQQKELTLQGVPTLESLAKLPLRSPSNQLVALAKATREFESRLGFRTPREFAQAQATGIYTAVREARDSNAPLPLALPIPAQTVDGVTETFRILT
jgi:predicted RecB family nuclease